MGENPPEVALGQYWRRKTGAVYRVQQFRGARSQDCLLVPVFVPEGVKAKKSWKYVPHVRTDMQHVSDPLVLPAATPESDDDEMRFARMLSALSDVGFTEKERSAVLDLCKRQELSPLQVIRQALRQYQAVALGHCKLDTRSPLPLLAPSTDSQ